MLAWRSRCFPRSIDTLTAVLEVFVAAYNRFGLQRRCTETEEKTQDLASYLSRFLISCKSTRFATPNSKNHLRCSHTCANGSPKISMVAMIASYVMNIIFDPKLGHALSSSQTLCWEKDKRNYPIGAPRAKFFCFNLLKRTLQ